MKMKYLRQIMVALFFFTTLWLSGCSTSNVPDATDDSETTAYKSLAPRKVDIRGSIVRRQYDQGQVMLEVEGFGTSPDSRYDRAYVLVLPTTQIVAPDGRTMSLSELQLGQNVAIFMRGGGQGTFVGVGVARKLWLEEIL